jgi:hypothetical protein
MGSQRRVAVGLAAFAVAMMSAGGAWAATSGVSSSTTQAETTTSEEPHSASSTSFVDVSTSSSTSSTVSSTSPTVTTHGATPTTARHGDGNDASHDDEGVTPKPNKVVPAGCKPGWGYGDKNHCHFGPPGQKKNKRSGNHHG